MRFRRALPVIISIMSEPHEQATIPDGLDAADSSSLESKIADFVSAGASGLHIVFDFDRTLTVKKSGSKDEVTTWHILREHLPEDGRFRYQKLFEKYRPLEVSGNMTQHDAVIWWSSILNLFVEYGVNLTLVEEDFLDRASIRPGTAELFKLCADNNIPTVVLSAGIREVIDIWCRKYEVEPSLVISTTLVLDQNGRITGWGKGTLVHALNKSEANHPELLALRTRRPKTLLVGDSLDDAVMVPGEYDVVRIRVFDPRPDEVANGHEKQKIFGKFDVLIKSGSLHPLGELVKLFI